MLHIEVSTKYILQLVINQIWLNVEVGIKCCERSSLESRLVDIEVDIKGCDDGKRFFLYRR